MSNSESVTQNCVTHDGVKLIGKPSALLNIVKRIRFVIESVCPVNICTDVCRLQHMQVPIRAP